MMSSHRNSFPAITFEAGEFFDRIRELYICEEGSLLSSIKRGDRREAIRIINRILVHIYSEGAERSDLLKGLLLELIVMMSRAAVEAGAPQTAVLGLGFRHLTELADMNDDEQLSGWLRGSVFRIFDAVESCAEPPPDQTIFKAVHYIHEHAGEPLTREMLAKHVGLSASRLGEILRERTGRTFSALLSEARVEAACGLLAGTDLPLARIAAECGFCDQSYFTHVFQESKNMTPRQYRASVMAKTQKIPL